MERSVAVEQIAKACHEVNRIYCQTLGDLSQPSWEDAPEWQKKSAINGVNFHLDNPNSTPADSHNNWLLEKINDGWVYGPVKNVDTKEHPCIMPYEQLPLGQRLKDSFFVSIVKSFL